MPNRPYNPRAYVPGGSSTAVAKAIQAGGYQNPGPHPAQIPQAMAAPPTGAAPGVPSVASNPFETDPGYLAALAAEQAGSQEADAALRAAQAQAIVRFGDPSLAGLAGFTLDPLTAAMAQQNTQSGNSTLAGLQRQRDQNQQALVNQNAAHGLAYSGQLGYGTGQNEQNYGTALFGAQQDLLDQLSGIGRDTVAQKQGLRQNTVSALTSAYGNYVANPSMWGAVDTGGAQAAANTAALAAGAPAGGVASAMGSKPKSKLAMPTAANPYAARTARQTVGYG